VWVGFFIDSSAQETGNSASEDDASAALSPEWFGVSGKLAKARPERERCMAFYGS
jgi:hypothetical protein